MQQTGMKGTKQMRNSPIIITKKLMSRLCLYLIIAAIALYQGCLLVDEYYTACDTLVGLFSPTRLQLPAFSLCVPLEEVVSVSIAHWKAHNHQNYTTAAHVYEARIMDCKLNESSTGSNKKFCTRAALTRYGILTMNDVFDGFLLTDSNLYFRTTLMDEQSKAVSLYTPMTSLAGELCYTYFYKEAPTMGRKFGSLSWELIEAQQPLFTIQVLIIENLLLTGGRALSQSETDWSSVRPLLWEFHSPIVRGRQFAVEPLTPGYSWVSRFKYDTMDYSLCSLNDKCSTYAQPYRIDPLLGKDSEINLSQPMSQDDCHMQKALQVSSSEWECLAYGLLIMSITKWELPKDRKLHHCDLMHGPHEVSHMLLYSFYERAKNGSLRVDQCPRDCVNYVYAFTTRSNQRVYLRDAIRKAFNGTYDESISSTLVMSPEVVPFMQIERRNSMTQIQFVCNVCSLLGMWFGLSVLGILDKGRKLVTRLITLAKEKHRTKTSNQQASENPPRMRPSTTIINQQQIQHVHHIPRAYLVASSRSATPADRSFYVRY